MKPKFKNLQKIESSLLADYILFRCGPMSHLKLQKLLYYCDAYHLAYFEIELITDKFEAWAHGPVSRKLFEAFPDKSILYADFDFQGDVNIIQKEFSALTSIQQELIEDVLSVLSTWTSPQLESTIQKEKPWIEARGSLGIGDRCHVEISKESMKEYYKSELE